MKTKFESYFRAVLCCAFVLGLSFCQQSRPSSPSSEFAEKFEGKDQIGYASWYGDQFHGKKTSSGETYDMYAMTAAHRTAPFGTNVRVTNLNNGKSTMVVINDRGPFVRGRIIDLSKKAAEEIGMIGIGTSKVKLEFLKYTPVSMGNAFIQIGSFVSEDNAKLQLSSFHRSFPQLSARIQMENNYYRLWIGPYTSDAKARDDLALMQKSEFNGFILHP